MAAEESGGELGATPKSPEFDSLRQRRQGRHWKLRLFLLVLVLVGMGGGAGWVFLDVLFPPVTSFETPLIRADASPVKVRPRNPGGMEVQNQDKLVYDRIANGERAPSVERLMPPPETPLKPPGGGAMKPAPVAGKTSELLRDSTISAPVETPVTPSVSQITSENKDEIAPKKAGPMAAVVAKPPAPAPAPAPPAPPVPPASKKPFKVQLGAVRSPQRASQEWERLRRNHGDLLRRMDLFVTKADLGAEKGVFYRMRAGPIADEATARGVCATLIMRKVGCLVVLPGE